MHVGIVVFSSYRDQKIVQRLSGDRTELMNARQRIPFYRVCSDGIAMAYIVMTI